MKKFTKFAVAGLLALSLAGLTACGGNNDNDQAANNDAPPADEKTYIVGTNATFPPFEFQDEDGNIMGFDVELIKAIAADQGLAVEVQDMEFDGLIMALQNESIDIVVAGMTMDEDRRAQVAFTDSYYTAGLNIAVAADNTTIQGVDDLKDKVVAAQIGTTGAIKTAELAEQGLVKEAKVLADVNLCMMDLANGGCDAVINDIPVTKAYMLANPDTIKVVGEEFDPEEYGIAVNQNNTALLEKLNTGLANVIENGTYDELYTKYFDTDNTAGEEADGADTDNSADDEGNAEADEENTAAE